MPKITTHLWYDKEAKEAAELYVSAFGKNSRIKNLTILQNTPSGTVDVITVDLWGQEFTLLSAGPLFTFNPSISFHAVCKTKEEVNALWEKLSAGGKVLMELGSYPFSERYGWTEDRYGLSWQIIYFPQPEVLQKITPVLMFVGNACGKAEEAINFWTAVFPESKSGDIRRYGQGEAPNTEGTVMYAPFWLSGQEFGAMDSAHKHDFAFNEAISLMVHCDTQKEIDYYWEKLSAVPEAEQCGWLKDKFGVSWQIVPTAMDEMFKTKDEKRLARVTEAFLKMKKFDIAKLQQVAEEK